MAELRIVSLDEVLELHDRWIDTLGGSPGVWAPSVLLYAYEVQFSPYYNGLIEKAANFGGRITKEHAFVDGNKRTGYSCARLLLARNGLSLRPSFDAAYEAMRRLAVGSRLPEEMTYAEFAQWLRVNSVNVEPNLPHENHSNP